MPPGISEDPFVLKQKMARGSLSFLGHPTLSSPPATTQPPTVH